MNPNSNVCEGITLADVLAHIDGGHKFDIEFVTADKRHEDGGEWVALFGCVKNLSNAGGAESKLNVTVKRSLKNPNHFQNSTRNIYILINGEIRKIHIRLITVFNGQFVL